MLLLLVGLSFVSATSARRQLVDGRKALDEGKARLLDGHAAGAARSFAGAARSFSGARSDAHSLWMRMLGWIPLAGRTPDAVAALTEASTQTAEAAGELSRAIAKVPGGITSLAPSGGRIPLDRLAALADAVRRADEQTGVALEAVRDSPSTLLIGPVADARRQAEEQLGSVHDTLHSASLVLQRLPAFVGETRPERYFLGAANPTESRGTAGFIGAYSILTFDRGKLSFSPVRPVQDLPILNVNHLPAPNPDYARIYNPNRDGSGFWLNINATPDFPSAAQAIEIAYEKATGEQLDGVITTDPFALQALLKVTGPTRIVGYRTALTAGNVVDFTTNGAYSVFPDPRTRKVVLGTVAKTVFERFLERRNRTTQDLRTIAESAAEGHIQVYSDDPRMQKGLARTGMGGAFAAPQGDFLSIVQNNASGSKVDYYLDRDVSYSVALGDDGSARATVQLGLDNHAPRTGQPRYVIGPFRVPGRGASRPGENVSQVDVFCGRGCTRARSDARGNVTAFGHDRELGYPFYRYVFRIPSKGTAGLSVALELPHAWQGNSSGGTYRLTILNQPTIRASTVHVEVAVPPGMEIATASKGMDVAAGKATWEGVPTRRMELDVSFRPSLPVRIWRDIVRFFSTPVIGF